MSDFYAIETSELSKTFDKIRAVDKLDMKVPAGSIFGLLGPNGAGKTTTFSMICGFIRPTSGTASVLGYPLASFPRTSGLLSALPQDARFFPERTVRDNMIFLGMLSGLTRETAEKQCAELLEKVGLTESAGMKGGNLSHGMLKRFGIAQAFLGNPELVLLDEPTAGLDPRNAHTARQMIKALAGRATVVVSSHNLVEVQDLCTHAAIIDHGRLVSSGSMDELTSRNQQVILTIGNLTEDLARRIQGLPGVTSVAASGNGSELQIMYRPEAGQDADQVVSQIVAGAVVAGASVSGVKRGHGLEQRYLEVT